MNTTKWVHGVAPPEAELVQELTRIVRLADEEFEQAGGSSRHWVRDHFLPNLHAAGWRISRPVDFTTPDTPPPGAREGA